MTDFSIVPKEVMDTLMTETGYRVIGPCVLRS